MEKQLHTALPELWGGIECTINRVQNNFFDQLEYAGHYNRRNDIDLLAATGIKKIRYPILWEKHQPLKDSVIDWSWTSDRLKQLQEKNIDIIAGLVHHGSGPAFTHMLDDRFPELMANYASRVIQQFPHINYFTPVNEPLTTARFSGLYGLWYPHKSDDTSFLHMLMNEIKGVVLSMQAIRKINPSAKLVQTEDLGKIYSTRSLQYQADFENERRWLPFELLCGKVVKGHPLWKYLLKQKISEKDLAFFQENPCVPDVFGFNHYLTSERFLDGRINRYPPHTHGGNGHQVYADVEAVRMELKEKTGISVLLKEAWERYQMPIALTEVHLHCHREEQLRWFKHVWNSCVTLRQEGVQVEALTTWAMLGSFGWNKLLTAPCGEYEAGMFDVRSGEPRPTALAGYIKKLVGGGADDHHLAVDKGWWVRPTRFFHKPLLLQNRVELTSQCRAPLLIIGRTGSLGRAFAQVCEQRFLRFVVVGREECDISDPASIDRTLEKYKPWAVINTAGYVRLDDAEYEAEKCFADNAAGAQNLASATLKYGMKLISFSSDLVFDGEKRAPYLEADEPNPVNVYGRSKAESEKLVLSTNPDALVIRTSAFFSPWDNYNFAAQVHRSLLNEDVIPVAFDAIVSPTYVPDLVHATLDLLVDEEKGIWHLSNNGEISWADFANEVADRLGLNRKYINPIRSSEFGFTAKRPLYSVLSSSRGIMLPSLDDALKRFTREKRQEKQMQKRERA